MKKIGYIILVFASLVSCGGNQNDLYSTAASLSETYLPNSLNNTQISYPLKSLSIENYSIEEINDDYDFEFGTDYYKYNYKQGGYYNYDISGYDEDGNYVFGNVDIDESGDGYIEDEFGNEKHIEVEWVDYGVMEGYDEDGVYYEFEVD